MMPRVPTLPLCAMPPPPGLGPAGLLGLKHSKTWKVRTRCCCQPQERALCACTSTVTAVEAGLTARAAAAAGDHKVGTVHG